ncbi:MAG: hypothetical protein CVU48_00720 [Candidatus Cloacimonetes bacterium HGW-Cloacimonetes-1]|jgi:membrane-associated PAP2 superfamily phosphatase/uncharacterized protein YuzE|nr:MAG: hypothetical protein CVU48_00720 [Candidatus Cloacimonetes bacterium HGW-Cloacimonetes-1]
MNPKHNKLNTDTDMTAYPSRHFLLTFDFWLPVLLMMVSFYAFRSTDWDMKLQRALFNIHSDWSYGDKALLKFVYHYGNIPSILIALSGLVVFAISFSKKKIMPYRKIGLFLLLSMILGPGLIVNSVLKDNWGRPRPREIVEFGGKYQYEPLLVYDSASTGKSFPCGHATVGFYLFVPWFILRRRKRILAIVSLVGGIGYGGLIGFARMAQGGHFASDVVWAGIIVYLCSFLIYRALGLHRQLWYIPKHAEVKKLKLHHKLMALGLAILLIGGVLLATPYSKKQIVHLNTVADSITLSMELITGDITVLPDSINWMVSNSNGFGFPGSKLKLRLRDNLDNPMVYQTQKGYFSEINNSTILYISSGRSNILRLKTAKGDISVDVSQHPELDGLECETAEGNVILSMPKTSHSTLYVNPSAKIDKQNDSVEVVLDGAHGQSGSAYSAHAKHGTIFIK